MRKLVAHILLGLLAACMGNCAQYTAEAGIVGYLLPLVALPGASAAITEETPADDSGDSDSGDAGTSPDPVQGSTATTITGSPATITIGSVDTSRAFVVCSQTVSDSDADKLVTCQLSSATTVTVETGNASSQDVAVYVREFPTGEAAVQRGAEAFGGGDNTRDVGERIDHRVPGSPRLDLRFERREIPVAVTD